MSAVASVEGPITPAPHLRLWAERLEQHDRTVTVAPRGHLKSTLLYAYLAWRLSRMEQRSIRALYFSAKRELAQEHLRLCKDYIEALDLPGLEPLSDAESILRFRKDNYVFECVPEGILAASRGRHVDILLLDDVLVDPASPLKLDLIANVTRIFQRKLVPMLKGAATVIHVIGTPLAENDLLSYLKENAEFDYAEYPAIMEDSQPLWPEHYTLEMLERIRSTIGAAAFDIEYQLKPAVQGVSYLDPALVTAAIYDPAQRSKDEDYLCRS
ncbi:hypothetical protein HYR54_00915 [Candidatus Acetothermia bacterium]|nr:hypothetical protein [Candidatus Acetothermia bacterium]